MVIIIPGFEQHGYKAMELKPLISKASEISSVKQGSSEASSGSMVTSTSEAAKN